jgi:hypothetical protein
MKLRNPEDDVALADGHAFMVETEPYLKHLSNSTDMKQVWHATFVSDRMAYTDPQLEVILSQLQGDGFGQFKQKKQGCHWHRCLCLCPAWLLYSTYCG